MIPKVPPTSTLDLRDLHAAMASSYSSLNQRANAVDSLKKARALGDRRDLHQQLIVEMNAAAAPPAEMEPVVNEYVKKYGDRPERLTMRSLPGASLSAG